MNNDQVLMAGGLAASTRIPPFHLIPTVAIEGLAERFALGVERKGDKAWNAMSANQACLEDVPFAVDRIGHAIHHAIKLRDKLVSGDVAGIIADDDAGAIAWAGAFLLCVVDKIKKANQPKESLK